MIEYVLGFVVVILLLALVYTQWNQQTGFPITFQTYKQYQIHRETKKLLELAKPYYCDFAKQAIAIIKGNMPQSITASSSAIIKGLDEDIDRTSKSASPTASIGVQILVIAKLMVESISDGDTITVAKIQEQLDLLYAAFCGGVTTVRTYTLPTDINTYKNMAYGGYGSASMMSTQPAIVSMGPIQKL